MRPIDAFAYSHSLYFDWAVAEFPGDVLRVPFRSTEIHALSIDEFKLIKCSVEATSSTISGDQRSTAEDPVWRLRRYATLCKSKWIGELQKMRCYFKISFPSVLGWRISRNPPSSFAPSQSSVRTPQWEPCKAHKASQSDEIAMLGGCFLIFRILSCQASWSALVEP